MMLASAIQAGFGGRPELIVDALKEGPKAHRRDRADGGGDGCDDPGGDVLADVAWQAGRGDAQQVLDGLAATMGSSGGLAGDVPRAAGVAVRDDRAAGDDGGVVHALVAAVSGRRVRADRVVVVGVARDARLGSPAGPLTVALVLAKPAITITLVVGTKLLANAGAPGTTGASSGASALGDVARRVLVLRDRRVCRPGSSSGCCRAWRAASVATGVAGGWGRSAMTGGADRV